MSDVFDEQANFNCSYDVGKDLAEENSTGLSGRNRSLRLSLLSSGRASMELLIC
jgi:hypothetical protein